MTYGYREAESGNIKDAIRKFREAIPLARDDNRRESHARASLGRALTAIGSYQEALIELDQARISDPTNSDAAFRKGEVLHHMERYNEAVVELESAAVLIHPKRSADVHLLLASSIRGLCGSDDTEEGYLRASNVECLDRAIRQAELATKADPSRTDAYHLLGFLQSALGYFSKALRHLKRANRMLSPRRDVLLVRDLAHASRGHGDTREAIKYYHIYLSLRPDDHAISWELGSLYAQRNQLIQAQRYMSRALQMGNLSSVRDWNERVSNCSTTARIDVPPKSSRGVSPFRLDIFGRMEECDVMHVDPEHRDIARQDFTKARARGRPFIVRRHNKIVRSENNSPKLKTILDIAGDSIVPVSHMYTNGRVALVRRPDFASSSLSSSWQSQLAKDEFDRSVIFKPPRSFGRLRDAIRYISMCEALDSFSASSPRETTQSSANLLPVETTARAYLSQVALEMYIPELISEYRLPSFAANVSRVERRTLWISRGYTHANLHRDPNDNLLHVIQGRKEVLLFHPSDNPKIGLGDAKTEFRPRFDLRSNSISRWRGRSFERTRLNTNHASVNVTHPSLSSHPEYARATPTLCDIREGDFLYIPRMFAHAVYSHAATRGRRRKDIPHHNTDEKGEEGACPALNFEHEDGLALNHAVNWWLHPAEAGRASGHTTG